MTRSTADSSSVLRWLLPLLLVAIISTLVLRGTRRDHPAVGGPAPELNLVELSDDLQLTPIRDTKSRVLLLHFWGTWCPPCQLEYPELAEMVKRHKDASEFCFLPVSCEGQADTLENLWAQTKSYFQREKVNSPAFADPRGITRRSAAERLNQSAMFYPTTILIDSGGRIAAVWEGYTPSAVSEMERKLTELLGR